ncbi:hypothetical protein O9993_00315 [Vibrio lentus]|nr:hypothetical protein [Vibrio lentus]
MARGLNGLAPALSLRKFGIKARIYEKAAQPRADGEGQVSSCGQRACRYLRHWLVSIK